MDTIASFTVDHLRLLPGVYVSRADRIGTETVTTFVRKESDSDFGRFMLVYFSDFMKPSEIEETVAAMPKKSQAHPEVRALLAKIKGKGRR